MVVNASKQTLAGVTSLVRWFNSRRINSNCNSRCCNSNAFYSDQYLRDSKSGNTHHCASWKLAVWKHFIDLLFNIDLKQLFA
jgi:hypothetical protein